MARWKNQRLGIGVGYGGDRSWGLHKLGCVAEYWSDLGITIGTGVAAWADQSGVSGVPWVQATAGSQPAYNATGWGGDSGPSIDFDNSDDTMNAAGLATYFSGTDPAHTVIMLAQFQTLIAGNAYYFAAYGATGPARYDYAYDATPNYFCLRSDNAGAYKQPVGGTPNTDRHVLTLTSTGTAVSIYVDGVVALNAGDVNIGAMTCSTVYLGNLTWPGNYPAHLRIAHLSIFPTALSAADRALVEAYIVARRGV
jgi:hypothetical protein